MGIHSCRISDALDALLKEPHIRGPKEGELPVSMPVKGCRREGGALPTGIYVGSPPLGWGPSGRGGPCTTICEGLQAEKHVVMCIRSPPKECGPSGKGAPCTSAHGGLLAGSRCGAGCGSVLEAHLWGGAPQEGVVLVPVPVEGRGREACVAAEHGPRRLEPAHHLALLGGLRGPSQCTHQRCITCSSLAVPSSLHSAHISAASHAPAWQCPAAFKSLDGAPITLHHMLQADPLHQPLEAFRGTPLHIFGAPPVSPLLVLLGEPHWRR